MMICRAFSSIACGVLVGIGALPVAAAPPAAVSPRSPTATAPEPQPGAALQSRSRPAVALPPHHPAAAPARPTAAQAPGPPAPLRPGDYDPAKMATRYRFHNGIWWFWLPSQQWAFFNGQQWITQRPRAYQEWRLRQFGSHHDESAARDATERYRDVDRWRERVGRQAMGGADRLRSTAAADADYHRQIDRFHNTLMTTPYDYRLGTPGHGLFDADPDRVISQSGRLNYATSAGGYMGGALRGPFGY